MSIKMIKDDVSIEPLENEVCDGNSGRCTFTITHGVWLDLRAGGGGIQIARLCETCATELAKRIKDTLPEDDGTQ